VRVAALQQLEDRRNRGLANLDEGQVGLAALLLVRALQVFDEDATFAGLSGF
jgi:hypothetical protein